MRLILSKNRLKEVTNARKTENDVHGVGRFVDTCWIHTFNDLETPTGTRVIIPILEINGTFRRSSDFSRSKERLKSLLQTNAL